MLKNPGRFVAVGGLGNVFVFLGKIFVCALTTFIGYLIVTKTPSIADKIYSAFIPALLIAIIAYCVGYLFMSVYGMAVDAILHCFLLDEELGK